MRHVLFVNPEGCASSQHALHYLSTKVAADARVRNSFIIVDVVRHPRLPAFVTHVPMALTAGGQVVPAQDLMALLQRLTPAKPPGAEPGHPMAADAPPADVEPFSVAEMSGRGLSDAFSYLDDRDTRVCVRGFVGAESDPPRIETRVEEEDPKRKGGSSRDGGGGGRELTPEMLMAQRDRDLLR